MAIEFDGPAIGAARIALGGVAHKPWRDVEAEGLLVGQKPGLEAFRGVADHILATAVGYEHNRFKIELARRAVVRALQQAAAATPQAVAGKQIN